MTTAVGEVERVRVEETRERFLHDYVRSRPDALRGWTARYLDSPECRHGIARSEATTFGAVLRALNETAPLSPPYGYELGGQRFAVRVMHALCDDFHGDRFGAFGEPLTLRMYLADAAGLPEEMFRLADWNFVDGGLPFFVGYAYGSRLGGVMYLSGLQSDIAQRYSYLFQGRGGRTSVREGEEVVERSTADLTERYGRFVPALRRVFQRQWIRALLAGVVRASRALGGIDAIALHQFPLEAAEREPGSIVFRIYRQLPRRIPGTPLEVAADDHVYRYHRMRLDDVEAYAREGHGRAR